MGNQGRAGKEPPTTIFIATSPEDEQRRGRTSRGAAPTSYAWARAVEAKAREILASLVERPAGVVTKP